MFTRRIEPKPNHALLFPQKTPKEVIIGKAVFVARVLRLEIKHIQLDDFQMSLGFGEGLPNPPAKTAEDLQCRVEVFLRIQIKHDPDSLQLATETWPASSSIEPPITQDHFKRQLNSPLVSTIESEVRKASYLELLLSVDAKANLESTIRTACTNVVQCRGFELLGCRVDVQTAEPTADALTHNAELNSKWNSHITEKHQLELKEKERNINHFAAILKLQNDEVNKKKQLETQSKVDLEEEKNRCESILRDLRNKDRENQKEAKEKSEPIAKAIATVDDTIQRQKIEFEHDRKKLEIQRQAERDAFDSKMKQDAAKTQESHEQVMLQMKRDSEVKKANHDLNMEKQKVELLTLEVQKIDLQKQKDSVEAAKVLELGTAKAEVQRLQTLAAKADAIQLSECLLKALPEILEKAYQPCQKIGDVRMLVVSGDRQLIHNSEHHNTENGLMNTLLSSMSLIPLVREVIDFVKEGASVVSPPKPVHQKEADMETEIRIDQDIT